MGDIGLSLRPQLSSIGDCLPYFVEKASGPAHIKDMQTGKYCFGNYPYLKTLKLQSIHDLLGLTIRDVLIGNAIYKQQSTVAITTWKNDALKRTHQIEHQLQTSYRPIDNPNTVWIGADGLIQIHNTVKIPIPSRDNKKIIAIFTSSEDKTDQLNFFKVFQLYQRYYPGNQAIQQMLRHLKIDGYFDPLDLPTVQEMRLLFALGQDVRHKCVARLLNLTPGTVEVYISKLRRKIVTPSNLHHILIHLRPLPEEHSENIWESF